MLFALAREQRRESRSTGAAGICFGKSVSLSPAEPDECNGRQVMTDEQWPPGARRARSSASASLPAAHALCVPLPLLPCPVQPCPTISIGWRLGGAVRHAEKGAGTSLPGGARARSHHVQMADAGRHGEGEGRTCRDASGAYLPTYLPGAGSDSLLAPCWMPSVPHPMANKRSSFFHFK